MVLGGEGRKGEGGWIGCDRGHDIMWLCGTVAFSKSMHVYFNWKALPFPPSNGDPSSLKTWATHQIKPPFKMITSVYLASSQTLHTFITYSMKFAQNFMLQSTNTQGLGTSLVFTTGQCVWTVVINCFFLQSLKQQRDKLKKYQKKVSGSLELRCYMPSWMCNGHLPVQIHQQVEKEREIAKQLLRDGKKK